MSDFRSEDVVKIVGAILEVSPDFWDNPNGPYTYTCPFCEEQSYSYGDDMNDINHGKDCAYIVAKDMSTGINLTPANAGRRER